MIIIGALALTWAVSDGVFARSTFQSDPFTSAPPPVETATATPTQYVPPSAPPTLTATATQVLPPTPTNTLVPGRTPTATLSATVTPRAVDTATPAPILPEPTSGFLPTVAAPTAPGFLPPPTLTNPDSLLPGRSTLPQAGGQPPLGGPAVRPAETAAADAVTPEAAGPAQLIDSGIVALSYLWLCCGFIFLVVAALTVIWLARRSRNR